MFLEIVNSMNIFACLLGGFGEPKTSGTYSLYILYQADHKVGDQSWSIQCHLKSAAKSGTLHLHTSTMFFTCRCGVTAIETSYRSPGAPSGPRSMLPHPVCTQLIRCWPWLNHSPWGCCIQTDQQRWDTGPAEL